MLRRPAWAVDATSPAPALPPRLAKIAALVIDGLTDKQISQRIGLTFSTRAAYSIALFLMYFGIFTRACWPANCIMFYEHMAKLLYLLRKKTR
jgi:hypothetical protein